jgi:hypothetical protein
MNPSKFFGWLHVRLITLATFMLSSTLCGYGQETQSKLSLGETLVDTPLRISVEDLQRGLKALNDLRQEREQFCKKEKNEKPQTTDPIIGGFCSWHQAVPQELRKELPISGYDQISDILWPPYSSYNLNRLQEGLDLQSLVPIDSVKDGRNTLRKWNLLADTGELFNCHDPVAIPNDPANKVPDNVASYNSGSGFRLASSHLPSQQRFAPTTRACLAVVRNTPKQLLHFLTVCEVLNISEVSGAPERCFPIAASSKSDVWILATTALYYVQLADNGKPDFTVNLFRYKGNRAAELDSGASLHMEDVLKAAEIAMSGPPLMLTTTIKSNVLGVAARRGSPVLGRPWNEQVTVRVDVSDIPIQGNGGVTGHNFELEVSTSILVNEQKDPDPSHWHAPTPAQAQAWNDVIRQRLSQEISHLCPHAGRKDDFTVVCKNP